MIFCLSVLRILSEFDDGTNTYPWTLSAYNGMISGNTDNWRGVRMECIDIFQRKGGHQSIDSDFKARGIFGDSRMSDPAKYCHPRVAFTTRIFPPRKWRGAFVFSCKNSTNYSFTAYFGLYGNAWRREVRDGEVPSQKELSSYFKELLSSKVPRQKGLSSSNEELFPNPARGFNLESWVELFMPQEVCERSLVFSGPTTSLKWEIHKAFWSDCWLHAWSRTIRFVREAIQCCSEISLRAFLGMFKHLFATFYCLKYTASPAEPICQKLFPCLEILVTAVKLTTALNNIPDE